MLDTVKTNVLMWIESIQEQHVPLVSLIGLFLVVVALYWLAFVRNWPLVREKPRMSAKTQRLAQAEGDAIVNGVEDAVFHGVLTRREAKQLYKRIATALADPNYLPRRKHHRQLKQEIKVRRATAKANGTDRPAPLPDAVVIDVPTTKKNGFGLRH